MLKKNNHLLQTFVVFGFGTIIYMLFHLAVSVYNSYQVNLRLERYKEENQKIEQDNLSKQEDYLYFNSELFKDKYAKENLNKLQDGEKMIVISEKKENVFVGGPLIEEKEDKISRIILLPNRQQWKEYFFGDVRL